MLQDFRLGVNLCFAAPLVLGGNVDSNREELDLALGRSILQQKTDSLLKELSHLKQHPSEDAIHDTRVQSRRLRAALEAFRDLCQPRPWQAAYDSVRGITRSLGKVRETEVMLSLVSDLYSGDEPAELLCREYLQERLVEEVRKLKKSLKENLRDIDTKRLRSQLYFLLAGLTIPEPATGGAAERGRRVLAVLAEPVLAVKTRYTLKRASDRRLHQLRIDTKKLRYAMEIFDEQFPGGLQAHIGYARALQDAAGHHQDLAVLVERLRREIRRLTRQRTTQLALQTGRLLALAEDRKFALRDGILTALLELQRGLREVLQGSSPEGDQV